MEAYVIGECALTRDEIAVRLESAGVRCPQRNRRSLAHAVRPPSVVTQSSIAFCVLDDGHDDAAVAIETLRTCGFRRVVAVGVANETEKILQCVRAGACDVLPLRRSFESEFREVVERLRADLSAELPPSKALAVASCGGGAGGTTIAASLAVASPGNRCLLDFNFANPDLASLLQVPTLYSLRDLLSVPEIDGSAFERTLLRHEESGVHLLAGAGPTADGGTASSERFAVDELARLILLARERYSAVIVELDDFRHPRNAALAANCDLTALVFRLDFISLARVKDRLERLEAAGIARESIRLVAGRFGQPLEIPPEKASEALGMPIAACIPNDPAAANQATNVGRPLVLASPQSKASKAIVVLAAALFEGVSTVNRSSTAVFRFARLFARPA